MNKKTQTSKYISLIILTISVIFYFLSIYAPQVLAAVYPFWIYKVWAQGFSALASLFPFSLAEGLLVLFPLYALYRLGKGVYQWMARTGRAGVYWRTLWRRTWETTCYLLSIFILSAGINYHRTSLAEYAGLDVQPAQKEELVQLCNYLADLTMESVMPVNQSFSQNKRLVNAAYNSLSDLYPVFKGWYPSSKPLLFSHWISYTHVMGFFFPFTFEANINKDIPAFMIPSVIAHEQAHLRGFMREEEAEYAVFLLARHTNDRSLKYSFYIATLMRSMDVLYRADPEAYQQLTADFSEELIADLVAYSDYWSRFRSPAGKISQAINDAYLKANSQSDGVQSYGRVVDLLTAEYKQIQTINNQEHENN